MTGAFRLSRGLPLNAFIAIDISWQFGLWDLQAEVFAQSWRDVMVGHEPMLELAEGRLDPNQRRLLADELRDGPHLLEELLGIYLERLPSELRADPARVDPILMCDEICSPLQEAKRVFRSRVEHYVHDPKIARLYGRIGAHALTPLLIATDGGLPAVGDVEGLHSALEIAQRLNSCDVQRLLARMGLLNTTANLRYLLFLIYNDPELAVDYSEAERSVRLAALYPGYKLICHHFDFGDSIKKEVNARAPDQPDLTDGYCIEPYLFISGLRRFGGPMPPRHFAEELTIKGFEVGRQPEQRVQGISASAYACIMAELTVTQRVTSLADIQRATGLELRIDPYDLDPGRLVAYVPGDRYLHGPQVSFALADWVADDAHRRSRIARDRILTPLTSIGSLPSAEAILAAAKATRAFHNAGVVFRSELISRMTPRTDSQAARWARERSTRLVDRALGIAGFVRCGDVHFFRRRWKLGNSKKESERKSRLKILAMLKSKSLNDELRIEGSLFDEIISRASTM